MTTAIPVILKDTEGNYVLPQSYQIKATAENLGSIRVGSGLNMSNDGVLSVSSDAKNTAGSTDTSSKIYLIGATSQAANPQTYSHDTVYVDTNGRLNSAAPDNSANDTTVATTKWVKDQAYAVDSNTVHKTGNEEIGGNKTLTGSTTFKQGSITQYYKATNYTTQTAPESDTYLTHRCYIDSASRAVMDEYYYIPKNTNRPTYLLRFRDCNGSSANVYKDIINCGWDGTNGYYNINDSSGITTRAPTPTEDTTTSKQIDTVGARNTKLGNYVPNIRTINNKALSSDITLTASDVGALPSSTVIPTVNNAKLTIQKNGTTVNTFTANASSNVTANITVPTTVAELSDSSDYATKGSLATVATSGSYADLTNKPTVDQTYNGSSTNAQSGVAVKSAIDSAVSSAYKAAGSVAFANLPTLSKTIEGNVYNLTDAFTTTANFVEGAGKSYPAGTNIVCINTATSGTAVYKWDVLAGFVDLSGYVQTSRKINNKALTSDIALSANDVGAVASNNAISGATKCKITYDSKGLVTAGANLSASDIPSLALSKISDVTATASEVNVLDGITASTTELNYTEGVTSNIQTQLNSKAADNSVVKLTGSQTIDGVKTFSDVIGTTTGKGISIKGTDHSFQIRSSGSPSNGCSLLVDNDTSKPAWAVGGAGTTITVGSNNVLPHSVTPSASDNSTRIATTAFVQGEISGKANDSNVVHKTGDETIAGTKTFTSIPFIKQSQPNIGIQYSGISKGTAPSSTINGWFGTIYDKNGVSQANKMAQIYHSLYSNGNSDISIALFAAVEGSTDNNRIALCHNGTKYYTICPPPVSSASTSATEIATVGWVNDPTKSTNVVHRTGNETIDGGKTFSDNVNANTSVTIGQHSVMTYNSTTEALEFSFI